MARFGSSLATGTGKKTAMSLITVIKPTKMKSNQIAQEAAIVTNADFALNILHNHGMGFSVFIETFSLRK